jgi:hypothetical protein
LQYAPGIDIPEIIIKKQYAMATVLKVNVQDLDNQFFRDLGQKIADTTQVEIRIPDEEPKIELFSEADFWGIIALFDWNKAEPEEIMAPAIQALAGMPVVNIYLFADKLAEKLYQLDTRLHGEAYLKSEGGDYLSVDDFLYVRCAVVAEGQAYFETVLQNPDELSSDISFEPLLNLPDQAYEVKTGRAFNYFPTLSYETYSNKNAWK